uniref:Uncharacterized protein n=1 Tax=Meloidogyne enterolobii TaxID=390850 RepID=A0A6V7WJU5_MELEN|nr:unnamed protein product [Meloidogyne enterolobii]
MIFLNGILFSFMKEYNPFIFHIGYIIWKYLLNLKVNLKINLRRYLLLVSIASFITLLYVLDLFLFITPYSFGGIKYFDNFNETWPFIQYKMETTIVISQIPVALVEISSTLIIFFCAFNMIRYVNLNSNFDEELKKLNKLLTKV